VWHSGVAILQLWRLRGGVFRCPRLEVDAECLADRAVLHLETGGSAQVQLDLLAVLAEGLQPLQLLARSVDPHGGLRGVELVRAFAAAHGFAITLRAQPQQVLTI